MTASQHCAECPPPPKGTDVLLNRGAGLLHLSFHIDAVDGSLTINLADLLLRSR